MTELVLSDPLDAEIPAAMAALDRLEIAVRDAKTFEAVADIADIAAGLQRRFKPVKGCADKAGEVWVAAETKIGEEIEKYPKAKGTRANFRGKPKSVGPSGSPKVEPPDNTPTLTQLKISKKRSTRARKLAALEPEKRVELIAELKAEDKAVTPDAILRKQRERNKREKKHTVATAVFSDKGPFDVVVIDPPWKVEKIDRDVRPNQDAFDYPTMSEDEIAAFWKADVACRLEPDCHLFMWTTQKWLPSALRLVEQFGFRYVLTMVWHKPGGFQPLDLPQYNCEFVIYARQGSPLFVDTKDFFCCFEAPRREHSRKPDVFYDTIRRVTGGSRIDVFSREARPGFAQFGNELTKFDEVA